MRENENDCERIAVVECVRLSEKQSNDEKCVVYECGLFPSFVPISILF